jgi:protein-tyrosine phosphatase
VSKILDKLVGVGADIVSEVENVLHGPVYPIHDYAEWVPVGGNMKFTRCSWTTPQVLTWLKGRGVTHVLNLCEERDDFDAVHAAGMMAFQARIPDGHAPSRRQAEEILIVADTIRSRASTRLAFHCEAGIGRTGCVAALLLVKFFGWTPLVALNDALRHGSLTPEQRDFILSL